MEIINFDYRFNNLDDIHPKSDNIPGLSIQLMNHQKTAIYHAQILEANNGFRINWEENITNYNSLYKEEDVKPYRDLFVNFGIIACKVGSGKSFVALGLIINNPCVNFDRVISAEKNSLVFAFKKVSTNNYSCSTNIILVPHNLFNQWKGYINTYTNLDCEFVGSKKEFAVIEKKMKKYHELKNTGVELTSSDSEVDEILEKTNSLNFEEKETLLNELTNKKVYLISSTVWNVFVDCWRICINKNVSRIFIDEVHSLHLPNSTRLRSNFVWFITSSLKDICHHRNNGFVRDTIDSYWIMSKQYQDYITIKNNDSYIDSSLKLPSPVQRTIFCKASVIINIFDGIINQEVKNMLLAEDIQGVVNYLGIETVSESNIIQVLCSNLEKELENAKTMYNAKQQMHYASEQTKTEALNKAKDKIASLQEKINNVRIRISESEMDPILHTDIVNPVITECCKNKFELESITSYYDYQKKKYGIVNCPICRTKLDLTKLIFVGEKKIETIEPPKINKWDFKEHTKTENLEYLLKNEITNDKKILIFSDHEGNIDTISEAFTKVGRPKLSPLKGSNSHISSLLDKFNTGEIPNLFLNARFCGSGLNIEKTDIIIIMHKMSDDNIKQIIGRGNRIGRTGALQVIFLYAHNE